MAHRSVISQHLNQPGISFITAGETYTTPVSGGEFSIQGTNDPTHHSIANAHLELTANHPGTWTLDIGHDADVWIEGMGSTSYRYDPVAHHMTLFAGNMAIDGFTVNAKDPIAVLSGIAMTPGGPLGTLITTGRVSPAEGYEHAIPVHPLTS